MVSRDLDFCTDFTVDECPCRIIKDSVEYCDFLRYYFKLLKIGDNIEIDRFSRLICNQNRGLISKIIDIRSKSIYEQIDNFIRLIDNGGIKSGDIVYCSKALEDVIFLEGPSLESIIQYKEDKVKYGIAPFTGEVTYKTFEGEKKTCPVASIKNISKGNYFNDYEVKGRGSKIKQRVEYLEYLARSFGYRVEKRSKKNSYLLRFFGDSQREIDDFIENCCYNDFVIW